ncbi:MAG: radical SAM protein [Thermoplasmata archaeon]
MNTEKNAKKITHITCKNALSPSRLSGLDYALNPYRGCIHACTYCYAPSILHEDRPWGSFIDLKENIPKVLAKELRNLQNEKVQRKHNNTNISIGIGTVTDAYQAIEKKELLTRYCLEQLSKFNFKVVIQTKSALVLRDLDLISKMKNAEVGFTVTSLSLKKIFEPNIETSENDLFKCARAFSGSGTDVFFFIGPVIPKVTLQDLDSILNLIKESGAKTVMADRLRLDKSFASWNIKQNLLSAYQNAGIDISLDEKTCEEEFKIVKNKIVDFCNKNKISFQE